MELLASDAELRALREQAEAALAKPVIRFIDLDPRLMLRLLGEIEHYRMPAMTSRRALADHEE